MDKTWFQVEFFSYTEKRWVPLFTGEKDQREATGKACDWLAGARCRVTRVSQTTETVWESTGPNETQKA